MSTALYKFASSLAPDQEYLNAYRNNQANAATARLVGMAPYATIPIGLAAGSICMQDDPLTGALIGGAVGGAIGYPINRMASVAEQFFNNRADLNRIKYLQATNNIPSSIIQG